MEKPQCWICCESVDFFAVGSCGHNDMCLKCVCRLRILQRDFKCPICKVEQRNVLITSDQSAKLDNYPILNNSGVAGIICDGEEAQKALDEIISFNCWLGGCKNNNRSKFRAKNQLIKHLEHFHKLFFCKICLKSRIVFTREQLLFKRHELEHHMKNGYKREVPHHPLCLFCNVRYYDESELRSHLESHHYFCNFCERDEAKNFYYKDYDTLMTHFQKQHFVCHHEMCRNNRFVVFKTEYDLQAHIQNVHLLKQNNITLQLGRNDRREEPNTEAVDFSGQFYPEIIAEERKKPVPNKKEKRYTKTKPVTFINYKQLPNRPASEIINELKEALNNDGELFAILKDSTVKFNQNKLRAEELLETFYFLFEDRTEILFPTMITSLKNQEKQEQLHRAFVQFVETKNNVNADGKCTNVFANCDSDYSIIKTLRDLILHELETRKNMSPQTILFVEEEHLKQMAAVIDTLTPGQLRSLSLSMNFGLNDQTRRNITQMLDKANDASFARSLSVKYESHFLRSIDIQQLYILYKYTDMGVAKIKGLPFKDETKYITNWKEETQEEEEKETGWSAAILGSKQKTPNFTVEEFPSLSTSLEASASHQKWSKFSKPEPPPKLMNFPTLGQPHINHGNRPPPKQPQQRWKKEENKKTDMFSADDFPKMG